MASTHEKQDDLRNPSLNKVIELYTEKKRNGIEYSEI